MSSSFRIVALQAERFAALGALSDEELRARGARRVTVDESPGYPCRVTLADASVGETVLLVQFVHHDVSSPYRGSGPIFVRPGRGTATPAVGEVPVMLRHRLLSVRAYDAEAMLVGATVVHGGELEHAIGAFFARDDASYLHIHNAGPGCFNCSVVRDGP